MTTRHEKGAVLVLVAVLLFALLGITALTIDIGHLVIVGNELQNSADAGALAGARVLINPDGSINTDANRIAYDTAVANLSGGQQVVITDWSSNHGDIRRGHWTFGVNGASAGFVPNDSDVQTNLFNSNLNTNTDVINAVEVTVSRNDIPSFFARIFGFDSFQRSKTAVAYIGFPSNFAAGDFDIPIAICLRSIVDTNGNITCNTGRLISSTTNTGGWTNFDQTCGIQPQTNNVSPLVCSGNTTEVNAGSISMNGGEIEPALKNVRNCWLGNLGGCTNQKCGNNVSVDADGNKTYMPIDLWDAEGNPFPDNIPDQPWNLTLPVVQCDDNNVVNCLPIAGAVNLSVVWITETGQGQVTVPSVMNHPQKGKWTRPAGSTDTEAWDDFVAFFELANYDGSPVVIDNKAIFALPSCQFVAPRGTTGGPGLGIQAANPVLVD